MTYDRPVVSPVSSTNKTNRHDIAEILLKVALNTIILTLLKVINDPCTLPVVCIFSCKCRTFGYVVMSFLCYVSVYFVAV